MDCAARNALPDFHRRGRNAHARWVTVVSTGQGLARLDPNQPEKEAHHASAPLTRILEISADGLVLDRARASKLKGEPSVSSSYTGVYLSAPERVTYSTKLEGLD